MTEKIIGALRISQDNCGLSDTDLTILNTVLSNCLSLDAAKLYSERIEAIWTRITLLNDFWMKRHDNSEF